MSVLVINLIVWVLIGLLVGALASLIGGSPPYGVGVGLAAAVATMVAIGVLDYFILPLLGYTGRLFAYCRLTPATDQGTISLNERSFSEAGDTMTADQSSTPNQHAQTRRQEILQAAAALFAEQGYQRTSVKEIAERAGIAPGTIYLYFDSKGDLLIGLMMCLAELEDLGDEVERALQNDPRAFLITMFRNRMGRVLESEEMLRAILPQMLVQPALRRQFHRQFVAPVIELMERYLDAQIARGDIHPIDAPLTVRAVQSMFIGLLLLRILGDDVLQERWGEMPEVVAALLFEGLSPRPDQGRSDSAIER